MFSQTFPDRSDSLRSGLALVIDKTNTASDVWADTAYRSAANEAHLACHGLRSKIHFRRKPGFDLTPTERRANRARAAAKIGLANLAYNIRRFIWIEGRTAPA